MFDWLKKFAYNFTFQKNLPGQGKDFSMTMILNWIYGFVGVVAVGYILYSAVLFILSKGDAAKAKQAKNGIYYAIAGLVIVMLAAVITNTVAGIVK